MGIRTRAWGSGPVDEDASSSGPAPVAVFASFVEAMLMARSTLCQLPTTAAIASVPSDNVDSFSSKASIWVATAALRSLSSFRFSSSAFFSSIRASSAGDCGAEAAELLAARKCDEKDLVGYDILGNQCLCLCGIHCDFDKQIGRAHV